MAMIRPAASISARWEKALGEVSEVPSSVDVELLCEQAERRGDPQETFHQVLGTLILTDDRQCGHEPEGTDQERALLSGQAVVGLVGSVARTNPFSVKSSAIASTLLRNRSSSSGRKPKIAASSVEASRESVSPLQAQDAVFGDTMLQDVGLDLLGRGPPAAAASAESPAISASFSARSSATQLISLDDT